MIPIILIAMLLAIIAELSLDIYQRSRVLLSRFTTVLRKRPQIQFDHSFIEVRSFFTSLFKEPPNMLVITGLDAAKAGKHIRDNLSRSVAQEFQQNRYSHERNRQEFNRIIFVLKDIGLVELGVDYAELVYKTNAAESVNELARTLAGFIQPEKAADFEINIITPCEGELELKRLPIKPVALDLDLYYNDDFKAVDGVIKDRLQRENDKGIVLLHGLPGTGKTTYLRSLIGNLNKRVLFVAPGVAANLMNPELLNMLLDNPNSVLVIEDAENIIMDRKISGSSAVSALLNISDGLLSDCLNVQLICTFNSELSLVDSALLRKGRLIASYAFGKLTTAKAQQLSKHLGFDREITKPMTLAEISNPDDIAAGAPKVTVMGFRRDQLTMN